MNAEHLIILVLLIGMVGLFLYGRNRLAKMRQELSQQAYDHRHQLEEQMAEAAEYKQQVRSNIHDTLPYGEAYLVDAFGRLLENEQFAHLTVYNQVEFQVGDGFKQADFLLVSPLGVYVIESKRWKGITYIYDENATPAMLRVPTFNSFGTGGTAKLRVFNAMWSQEKEGEIRLSKYTQPVAQVRGYSKYLSDIFKSASLDNILVYNVVAFCVHPGYEVLFNDAPLGIQPIDRFTTILTHTEMPHFLETRARDTLVDVEQVNRFIESQFQYRFKLNRRNFKEAPFGALLSMYDKVVN